MTFLKISFIIITFLIFIINNTILLVNGNNLLFQSSSSESNDLILSISTLVSGNNKEISLINPWLNKTQNNEIIYTTTIDIPFDILDILFVDYQEDTVVILCKNNSNIEMFDYFSLVSLDIGNNNNNKPTTFTQLNQIKTNLKSNEYSIPVLQKYIFSNKIGYIPISLNNSSDSSGDSSNIKSISYIMELNFPNDSFNLIPIIRENLINDSTIIQGFDYQNDIMYIAHELINESNTWSLIQYNPNNPKSTQIVDYYSIPNISKIYMIFTDLNGEIYFIAKECNNNNNDDDDNLIICKFNSKTGVCNSIYNTNIKIESLEFYKFLPYFLNQDKSSLILLSPITATANILNVEIIDINNNFNSISYIIPFDNDGHDIIWTKFAF